MRYIAIVSVLLLTACQTDSLFQNARDTFSTKPSRTVTCTTEYQGGVAYTVCR